MSTPEKLTNLAGDWQRLGSGFSVRFVLCGGSLDAHWQPRLPTQVESRGLLASYREARHAFLCALAEKTGRAVACVEA